MVLDVTLCSTEGFGIWRSAAGGGGHVTLIDPLRDQGAAHLPEELVVKPAHQAPHLDPRALFGRQQAALRHRGAAGLVEIFGNHTGAGNCERTLFHQNGRGSRRIEHQELGAPLPHPLLDEFCRPTVFLEHEADESGMWTNRMMEQRQHCTASLAEKSALPHDLPRIVLTKKP